MGAGLLKLLILILTTLLVPVFIALTLIARPGWLAAPWAFCACCFAAAATMDWILWSDEREEE